MRTLLCAFLVLLCGLVLGAEEASAQTGWSPVVVPRGAYRDQIKSMPIHLRPDRPFHFYGNTVRRNYYRSAPSYYRSTPSASYIVPETPVYRSYYPPQPMPSAPVWRGY